MMLRTMKSVRVHGRWDLVDRYAGVLEVPLSADLVIHPVSHLATVDDHPYCQRARIGGGLVFGFKEWREIAHGGPPICVVRDGSPSAPG